MAVATAQGSFSILEGSIHKYNVTVHTGNSYAWDVFYPTDLSHPIADPSVVEIKGGKNTAEISLQFNKVGDFVLVITESNGCSSNLKTLLIHVSQYSSDVTANAGADATIGNCKPYQLQGSGKTNGNSTADLVYHWMLVQGSSSVDASSLLDNPDSQNPTFNPGTVNTITQFTFRLTVTNTIMHTSASDDVVITVVPIPKTNILNIMQDGYALLKADMSVVTGSMNYQWNSEYSSAPIGVQDTLHAMKIGKYALTVTDNYGCSASANTVVTIIDHAPVLGADRDTTKEIVPVTINILKNDYDPDNDLDLSTLKIVEKPLHGQVVVNQNNTITYTPDDYFRNENDVFYYEVCDLAGLCSRAQVIVRVGEGDPLIVPQIFTPNGDGIHDRLAIKNIQHYKKNRITVFNRWESKVYEKYGYSNEEGWDGSANVKTIGKGQLPVGTYYYIIDKGDGSKPVTGWIYLQR